VSSNVRILVAELLGTCVLMLGGPGSAIIAADAIGVLGVSMAFGFSLLIMAYAIGPVSGCHINPAVTVGLFLARKLESARFVYYLVGQAVGAVLGGLIIFIIANDLNTFDAKNNFAQNGWDEWSPAGYGFLPMLVVEIVFTALLVYVVLTTTTRGFSPGFGGLAAGLTLTLIHLATIPVDNTSVNPARSLGSAKFAGGDALEQLWAFIVFPAIGAVVGAILFAVVHGEALPTVPRKAVAAR
jgi:aquaporin Z